jgi:hypothetical protein
MRPLVSVSALTWFIIYKNVYLYPNLQFLNNVIIIKTKVIHPHAYVTLVDFGCPV